MSYSVIIPTMWASLETLKIMLSKYESCSLVKEIIIINNKGEDTPNLIFSKLRFIGTGENIYVNPAWNLGVKEALGEKVLIANDDFVIDDFNELIILVDKNLRHGDVIGPYTSCFPQKNIERKDRNIISPPPLPKGKKSMNWGFGVLFFLYKDSYKIIPNYFDIVLGDYYQYCKLNPRLFTGFEVKTRMSTTIKKVDHILSYDLNNIIQKDFALYRKHYPNKFR